MKACSMCTADVDDGEVNYPHYYCDRITDEACS